MQSGVGNEPSSRMRDGEKEEKNGYLKMEVNSRGEVEQ
jgi:hypothetical protein